MKRVLFVCVENARRSQMAEALFNRLAEDRGKATSAGNHPGPRVDPKAVKVMKEIGIDMSCYKPKALTASMVKEADVVITMGCGAEACPVVPKRIDDWEIEDPAGKPIEKFREVRDIIKTKVETLVETLEVSQNNPL